MDGTVSLASGPGAPPPPSPPATGCCPARPRGGALPWLCPGHLRELWLPDASARALPPASGTPGPRTDPGHWRCSRPGAACRARPTGRLAGSGQQTPGRRNADRWCPRPAALRGRRTAPPRSRGLEHPDSWRAALSVLPFGLGVAPVQPPTWPPPVVPARAPASLGELRWLCCLTGAQPAWRGRQRGEARCSLTTPKCGLQAPSGGFPSAGSDFCRGREQHARLESPSLPWRGPLERRVLFLTPCPWRHSTPLC